MKVVRSIAYHRNGISGDGFYVAVVDSDDGRGMIAIVPSWAIEADNAAKECPSGCYPCYVIDPLLASQGVIAFGENSWRGDNYFDAVVEAIRSHEED